MADEVTGLENKNTANGYDKNNYDDLLRSVGAPEQVITAAKRAREYASQIRSVPRTYDTSDPEYFSGMADALHSQPVVTGKQMQSSSNYGNPLVHVLSAVCVAAQTSSTKDFANTNQSASRFKQGQASFTDYATKVAQLVQQYPEERFVIDKATGLPYIENKKLDGGVTQGFARQTNGFFGLGKNSGLRKNALSQNADLFDKSANGSQESYADIVRSSEDILTRLATLLEHRENYARDNNIKLDNDADIPGDDQIVRIQQAINNLQDLQKAYNEHCFVAQYLMEKYNKHAFALLIDWLGDGNSDTVYNQSSMFRSNYSGASDDQIYKGLRK